MVRINFHEELEIAERGLMAEGRSNAAIARSLVVNTNGKHFRIAFGESADVVRLLCIGLIVAGIAGLKLVTS